MFDPNQHPAQCANYMSHFLGAPVSFIRADALTQSTRLAPWRVHVCVNGVERAYVLQLDPRGMEHEYQVLKALEAAPFPTPRVYGLDLPGEALGIACFFSEFIEGESLLAPVLSGATWAEDLYLDAVCALLATTEDDLGAIAQKLERTTAEDVLEDAYADLKDQAIPLAETVYRRLRAEMPNLPALRFSNGDLWLDNFIVKDRQLAAIIDFQNAAFSDPVFEFLLSFFVAPELQGRGIEARFCRLIGVDPDILYWYHGLELFETWSWLLKTGKPFVHHTAESLTMDLTQWLEVNQVHAGR
ncbi:MAG: Phosphotransferase enzyme family protein [Chloroflexi bacterium ADurb.Bin360]|nr:MAG: Phosphotransferase enzyme family protein [Chloroflexi bacterium ADurb.Bin360]